jgi:GNAT superfamily N-acetyltransferase
MSKYLAPVPLIAGHDVSGFANGRHASLDGWLAQRAKAAEGLSARTYVIASLAAPRTVIGYHCILAAAAERAALPSARLRKDMPDPIPLLLIGRLAVDRLHQGKGLGSGLLVDAVGRCLAGSAIIGARGIVAHAIDEEAAVFYGKHGFIRTSVHERLMLLPMETAQQLMHQPG